VDTEPPTPTLTVDDAALIAAGKFFAARGVYGLAWMDADLTVLATYGEKAAFIVRGRPVTDSVFALIGAEAFIAGLREDPAQALELPGVVLVTGPDTQERYNLSLFWSAAAGRYLLLVARASIDATLEIELLRHVRARLMAEAEIRAKSEALARANRDLENFAAIISHDLKAPMRALRYMTEDVETSLAAGRVEEVRTQVAWMRSQSQRMSSMLSGLLDYSSIGRKVEAIETVDTRALVTAIVASLPRPQGFTVSIAGAWPIVDTLRVPLDLVLRNLLDNAIKHHDRPDGVVRIVAHETETHLVFVVEDDGAGIAVEHAETIFLPFRTLAAGDSATDSVGLGLALVRRTVESVGGSIRLAGSGGSSRGCVFEVTWPRQLATGPS